MRVEWIECQDNVGRHILYDFSEGSMGLLGVVTIPSSAVLSRPADESGTSYLLEMGFLQQEVSLEGGVYTISVPQPLEVPPSIPAASIAVDGSAAEWTGVAAYLTDRPAGYWTSWSNSGLDVEYVKLAYGANGSKLNILIKTADSIRQDAWYRLFLDRDLDGDVDEPGDFQIDFQYAGSSWDVVSQGWNSDDGWDWYPIEEGGTVVVSGQFIEGSVNAAAFGLPGDLNVFGRTMQNASPYASYDEFSTDFLETSGFASIGAINAGSLVPDEWEFSARISDFNNVQDQGYYGVGVGTGSSENDDLDADFEVGWFSGDYQGTHYSHALVMSASVENDLDEDPNAYEWEWAYGEGGGLLIEGLDPDTAVLDLKVAVSNSGQAASFYYRINSDPSGWHLAVSHTLPGGVGRMYGMFDTFPTIGLDADCAQVANSSLHDWNGDGIISIVGDVPPFVQCVYFNTCPDDMDTIAVGDCNHDGILSIVGDVPCFVECVYFDDCPE
ncbi:MAG: hypothetical protein ABFD90_02975 [Phycisphaerales bacterium]